MQLMISALLLGICLPLSLAQSPSAPTGLTLLRSHVNSAVTIAFKQTKICERRPGVKSYSGFVHLPGSILADVGGYDINSYFMYFEARQNPSTAPLAIYLAGGPGESSTYAALASESGPCYVNINGTDTVDNPWSFNNNVNMLYIDQPVQVGFSYDKLVNATFDFLQGGLITPINFSQSNLPAANATYGYGTYPSQEFARTANNTVQAGKALWHFAEHWLSSFPGYKTQSNKISIWGNSYGGYWAPQTAVQLSKSLKNLPSKHPLSAKRLSVDAVGITNGCVDIQSAMTGYIQFAFNNTYGVRFGSDADYTAAMNNLTKPGGCQDLIQQCRTSGEIGDSSYTGNNATVNAACMTAFYECATNVINSFDNLKQRDAFDIAIAASEPLPCEYYLPVSQYLNNPTTQQALGVPLNFTYDSNVVAANFGFYYGFSNFNPFSATGDAVRLNGLSNLEYLLANNVKVAFIFGDRDYRCPWTGGEATALAAKWSHQSDFANAGYEQMQGITTPANQGGHKAVVKQSGQFSFSRVLDAGHMVSAYAPETVYRIFDRTTRGVDVVTGTKQIDNSYRTKGPKHSLGWRNCLPKTEPRTCIVAGRFQDTNPWDAIYGKTG